MVIKTILACAHCNHPLHQTKACDTVIDTGSAIGCCGCQHYIVNVRTRPCIECGVTSEVPLDHYDLKRWQDGELVQNVFPDMTPDMRELLITGTHPKCWAKMFGGEEE